VAIFLFVPIMLQCVWSRLAHRVIHRAAPFWSLLD
jgi:hypothetical protein